MCRELLQPYRDLSPQGATGTKEPPKGSSQGVVLMDKKLRINTEVVLTRHFGGW